jgi:hypothetical protein
VLLQLYGAHLQQVCLPWHGHHDKHRLVFLTRKCAVGLSQAVQSLRWRAPMVLLQEKERLSPLCSQVAALAQQWLVHACVRARAVVTAEMS